MRSGVVVSKPQGEPGAKPAHNAHFLHSRVIGWELMSCALGAGWKPQGDGNHKVNRGQNQLTIYIFSISVSLAGSSCHVFWGEWCRNHKVKRGQNQLTLFISSFLCNWGQSQPCTFFPFRCHWLGPHVMCSRGLVSTAQHVAGTNQLTMHNFLYSHVIGWELMSCALGPGVETTK